MHNNNILIIMNNSNYNYFLNRPIIRVLYNYPYVVVDVTNMIKINYTIISN
jgi:hypothetical protein